MNPLWAAVPKLLAAYDRYVLRSFIVYRAGEVVSNRALLESVWQEITVEESSLRFHIKNLRKILQI